MCVFWGGSLPTILFCFFFFGRRTHSPHKEMTTVLDKWVLEQYNTVPREKGVRAMQDMFYRLQKGVTEEGLAAILEDMNHSQAFEFAVCKFCRDNGHPQPVVQSVSTLVDCTYSVTVDFGGGNVRFDAVRPNGTSARIAVFRCVWNYMVKHGHAKEEDKPMYFIDSCVPLLAPEPESSSASDELDFERLLKQYCKLKDLTAGPIPYFEDSGGVVVRANFNGKEMQFEGESRHQAFRKAWKFVETTDPIDVSLNHQFVVAMSSGDSVLAGQLQRRIVYEGDKKEAFESFATSLMNERERIKRAAEAANDLRAQVDKNVQAVQEYLLQLATTENVCPQLPQLPGIPENPDSDEQLNTTHEELRSVCAFLHACIDDVYEECRTNIRQKRRSDAVTSALTKKRQDILFAVQHLLQNTEIE